MREAAAAATTAFSRSNQFSYTQTDTPGTGALGALRPRLLLPTTTKPRPRDFGCSGYVAFYFYTIVLRQRVVPKRCVPGRTAGRATDGKERPPPPPPRFLTGRVTARCGFEKTRTEWRDFDDRGGRFSTQRTRGANKTIRRARDLGHKINRHRARVLTYSRP